MPQMMSPSGLQVVNLWPLSIIFDIFKVYLQVYEGFKVFGLYKLKGILSQKYDHCSEVFLHLESKIGTVQRQRGQIDKKLPQK